ncbi:fructosamine kinase family protein, partial [Roseovarius sp. SYSU LYC5161]|uniref:fructosamine kinase family protein n=1 Tax=Roseovarius halophilus (ex Wu et al. 2025) TaxID=3376060 RepID=UPI00399A096A
FFTYEFAFIVYPAIWAYFTKARPVPGVRHQAGDLLLLDALNETPASDAGWAALGAALRRLHISTADSYGWPEDYAFGSVGISNAPVSDWPRFWAENRLLAVPDCLPHDIRGRIDLLAHRLPDLLPASPPAALLHGDLWTGNVLFSGQNAFFIDPACYHGDGEVDLAMLRLFGAPPPPFFEGYGPLPAGHTARQPVYQLWPALVHLRLFGGGYRGMVTRLLDAADV